MGRALNTINANTSATTLRMGRSIWVPSDEMDGGPMCVRRVERPRGCTRTSPQRERAQSASRRSSPRGSGSEGLAFNDPEHARSNTEHRRLAVFLRPGERRRAQQLRVQPRQRGWVG